MLSIEDLVRLKSISDNGIKNIGTLINEMATFIERIKGYEQFTAKYKKESIAKEIDRLSPRLAGYVNDVRDSANKAAPELEFWDSTVFLLSMRAFHKDPEKDALIRLSYSNELAKMSEPLLSMTFKNALNEKNLPLIYQCYLTTSSKNQEVTELARSADMRYQESPDYLDKIIIPARKEAVSAILGCKDNVYVAESMADQFFEREPTPLNRLVIGRERQDTARRIEALNALG